MTFRIETQLIGVTGDWHGNTGWAKRVLTAFNELGIKHIFQLGDFGIWGGHDGASYVRKINKWLTQNDQILYVTPGNHEDYVRINSSPFSEDGTQQYQWYDRIKLLPRGFRGEFISTNKTVSWVSLGGANSIDFKGRREGISWWREESITFADVYKVIEGGEADLMFCHDAPAGVPMSYDRKSLDAGWHPDEVRYSNSGREMLRTAVDAVKPEVLFHGHFHIYQDINTELGVIGGSDSYKLRSIGLNMDDSKNSSIVYDPFSQEYVMVQI
jgi:Icc-related predicted phosphoesterase